MKPIHLLALLTTLFLGCSNPYAEAQQANTIEAYEKFLKENPSSIKVLDAKMALENLYIEQARKSKDPADYDKYIKRFEEHPPVQKRFDTIVEERKEVAWQKSIESNKPEDYQTFIKEYNLSDPRMTRLAKRRLKVAEYRSNLSMTPIAQERTNMGEDPDGPLNGWRFSTEVTNKGDKDIWMLKIRLVFLNAEGNVAAAEKETFIGELPGREWATPKEQKPPFKGGDTRPFTFLTGNTPPDWGGKVEMEFIEISFKK